MINPNDWPQPDGQTLFHYLAWNSFRSDRYKLLYVATPKVACTSLKWWFADLEGCKKALLTVTDSLETDPDLVIHDNFYKVAPSVTGLNAEALFEPLTSDAYIRFAVVRNPFKRIFSAWQSKLLLREPLQVGPYLNCPFFNRPIENATDAAKSFEAFLEHLAQNEAPNYLDVHWTPQARLLRPDLIPYSQIVQLESPQELGLALAERIGSRFTDPFTIRTANESLIPYLPQLVTDRSAELIRTMYAEDFDLFGYSKVLPDAKQQFSTDQFQVALRAVQMIRSRHQRFGEMIKRVNELNQTLIERDLTLIERNQILIERDLTLIERNQTLIECESEISQVYASLSWRFTRPLRYLKQIIRSSK